ncbi:hypothetical protein [Pyramidobacter piscolens]|uniref:hypothetical protein n=1 Tax=Pyramidobacter piscolens TaxID=638849 RepID=UPI003AB7CAF9
MLMMVPISSEQNSPCAIAPSASMQYRLTEMSMSLRRRNRLTFSTCVPHFSFFSVSSHSKRPGLFRQAGTIVLSGFSPTAASHYQSRGKAGEHSIFPAGNRCDFTIARGFFQRSGGCPRCRAAEIEDHAASPPGKSMKMPLPANRFARFH